MWDKLSILNSALIRAGGNNVVQFEDDGSPEWICSSDAYETELPLLLADHDWGFAATTATLQRAGDSPDPRFTDSYYRPVNCLHLEALWLNGAGTSYVILNNQIQCNAAAFGVDPVAKYICTPTNDQIPDLFTEVLRLRIMSWVYRSLNEDADEADKVYKFSEMKLATTKTRVDQEVPARAYVVSRLARARRIRRGGFGLNYSSQTATNPVD